MTIEEKAEISKLLIEKVIGKYPRIFTACSFGKDSRVIVDLVMQVRPDMMFYGIDTGYEFAETMEYAKKLADETKMNFEWARASEDDKNTIENKFVDEFVHDGQYKCCAMKEPAIRPVLAKYDAWITGLRRDESPSRKNTKIIEDGGSLIKINPIAFWTVDDIWEYIKKNDLSYHPLYDEGYPSLGCKPCTAKPTCKNGEYPKLERGGRFIDSSSWGGECGLHLM